MKTVIASALVRGVVLAGVAGASWAAAGEPAAALVPGAAALDTLYFRDGRVVEGTVLSETDTKVRVRVRVGGIEAETEYNKSDLLKIQRGESGGEPAPKPATPERGGEGLPPVKPAGEPTQSEGGPRVYVMELTGVFGEDISQTPIREALKDAAAHKPDYLVVRLENDWSLFGGMVELPDDVGAAHELFRAEDIAPVFASEMRDYFEDPPELVFWVKQAMGGSALLPFVAPNIYFARDARMGGIGNLSLMLEGRGEELVRQKLYSAYMAHAESWANTGGYDYRIVRAMAWFDYVLSVSFEGGRPVFHERAAGPGEILLTDDGKDANADTIQERARGEGNDVLTLHADLARNLLVSKGEADTYEELWSRLGIARSYQLVPGRAAQIMQNWSRGLDNAKRQLRRVVEDFGRVQVQGDYDDRKRARGQQIRLLDEMDKILKRFGEGIPGNWLAQNGVPDQATRNLLREQIKLEQLRDKR